MTMPYASGYYHSTRDLLLIPEQSKYTTALDMQPDSDQGSGDLHLPAFAAALAAAVVVGTLLADPRDRLDSG